MTERSDPPGGWTTWNAESEGRVILAFRPDVFDADRFPAPCLPTAHVSNGAPRRRPRVGVDRWRVTLRAEPEVAVVGPEDHDTREAALAAARDLAGRFDAGEVAYRSAYQVLDDRRAYLDRLDELTGRS